MAKKVASKSSTTTSPPPAPKPVVVMPAPAPAAPSSAARPNRRPTRDEIAKRAFEIWVAKGRPQGRDVENWKQAERELGAI